MFSFGKVYAVAKYELTSDLRKKRTLVILGLFLFSALTGGYVIPIAIGKNVASQGIGNLSTDGWWVTVIFLILNGFVAGLFPLLIGGFISTDSIASEFESNTIVPIFSQPIRRIEVYAGKLFEKFLLMLGVSVAFAGLTFIAAEVSIGGQMHLEWFPWIVLTLLGAFMEFAALAFFLGSFIRSSSMLLGILVAIFFGVIIAVGIVAIAFGQQEWMLAFPIGNVQMLVWVVLNYIQSPSGTIVLQANLELVHGQPSTMILASALNYVLGGLAINLVIPIVLGYFIFSRAEVRE
jgi:ABC-type transport system involved in multi-copper enzyme maturation permease subunit